MNHRMIVAWGFRVFGAVLGMCSLAAFVSIGMIIYRDSQLPLPALGRPFDSEHYGMTTTIANGEHLGTALNLLFLNLARSFAIVVETSLGVLMLLSVLLFFLGRSMAHQARWARILTIALCAFLFVYLCLFMLAHVPPVWKVAFGAGAAASLYTIWVLGWRYA